MSEERVPIGDLQEAMIRARDDVPWGEQRRELLADAANALGDLASRVEALEGALEDLIPWALAAVDGLAADINKGERIALWDELAGPTDEKNPLQRARDALAPPKREQSEQSEALPSLRANSRRSKREPTSGPGWPE